MERFLLASVADSVTEVCRDGCTSRYDYENLASVHG